MDEGQPMTTVTDRDSGEQQRIGITGRVVDLALWWLNGPDSQPPGWIARLPAEERAMLWQQVATIAALPSCQRDGFIPALVNYVTDRGRNRRRTDDVTGPGDGTGPGRAAGR